MVLLTFCLQVLREGKKAKIPAEELVPGDIVLIKSGDKIPADLRLITSTNLQVSHAASQQTAQRPCWIGMCVVVFLQQCTVRLQLWLQCVCHQVRVGGLGMCLCDMLSWAVVCRCKKRC